MRLTQTEKKRKTLFLTKITEKLIDGTLDMPDNTIVANVEEITTIFTKRRLELLGLIKKIRPQSLQELAIVTKRKKQAIHRDLKILGSVSN